MRPFFLFYAEDNRVRSVLRSCAINCGLDEAEPWLDEAEPSRGSSGVYFPSTIVPRSRRLYAGEHMGREAVWVGLLRVENSPDTLDHLWAMDLLLCAYPCASHRLVAAQPPLIQIVPGTVGLLRALGALDPADLTRRDSEKDQLEEGAIVPNLLPLPAALPRVPP